MPLLHRFSCSTRTVVGGGSAAFGPVAGAVHPARPTSRQQALASRRPRHDALSPTLPTRGSRAWGSSREVFPCALVVPARLESVAAGLHRAPPRRVGSAAVEQEQAA